MKHSFSFFMVCLILSTIAQGSVDKELPLDDSPVAEASQNDFMRLKLKVPVPAHELFNRSQAVLHHFGVEAEPSYQGDLNVFSQKQTLTGLQKILPILDPKNQFMRFAKIDQGASLLDGFQDRDSKIDSDFSVSLTLKQDVRGPLSDFRGTPALPLQGLRVALDPGHMGGKLWDERTGKYVVDHDGVKVSEGVINIQTSMLLRDRLQKLGATVMVTHEDFAPVEKNITWENINIEQFGKLKLLAESLQNWFVNLLATAPIGEDLYDNFENSAPIKKVFSDRMRWEYFVQGADLEARTQMIKKFNPDIVVIIHYDTSDPVGNSTGVNKRGYDATKVYVPGGYAPGEFSGRIQRKNFASHLLNPYEWDTSYRLGKSLLTSLKKGLGIRGDTSASDTTVLIEPGLQARNLYLTRKLSGMAISYVECLYYNDVHEFELMAAKDHMLKVGNEETTYSNRLVEVVNSLEEGVVNFVASHDGLVK